MLVVAFASAVAVSARVFPLYSINHDEPMYVYEARLLEGGHVTLPAREAEFFRPWAAGIRDGRIVMKYSPPWPAVIALSEGIFGTPRIALGCVAAFIVLGVFLLAHEVLARRRAALIAAAIAAFSPLVLVLSGTYLPYAFELALASWFGWLVLSGWRLGSRARLLLAGAVIGVAFFARPFDAALIALPFLASLAVSWAKNPRQLIRRLGFVAAGAAPLVVLTLAHNARTMGNPLQLPFSVTGPFDTLGFGRRGVFPTTTIEFTRTDGRNALTDNAKAFGSWMFGGWVTLVAAVVGFVRFRGAQYLRWSMAGVGVAFFGGYLFFWSPYAMSELWPGLSHLGPFYYVPVVLPLAIFAASFIDDVARRGWVIPSLLAAAMIGVTAWYLPLAIHRNLDVTRDLQNTSRLFDRARAHPSLAFVDTRPEDGYLSSAPFLEDDPDQSRTLLTAYDRGPQNFRLLKQLPRRRRWILVRELHRGEALLAPSDRLMRVKVVSGRTVAIQATISNPGNQPVVTVGASLDAGDSSTPIVSTVLDTNSQKGKHYTITWLLDRAGLTTETPFGPAQPATSPPPSATPGTVVLSIAFAPSSGDETVTDRYEERLNYALEPTSTEVMTPPKRQHLLRFSGGEVWIKEDIHRVVSIAVEPRG